MNDLCRCCEQSMDANDWCPRCEQHASEQPPEVTLEQFKAEHPEVLAEIRDRLARDLERDLAFTMELEANRRAA